MTYKNKNDKYFSRNQRGVLLINFSGVHFYMYLLFYIK